MSNIVFHNHYHCGDISASRGIIKKIIEQVRKIDPKTTFAYQHNNPANLLADIPKLSFAGSPTIPQHDNLVRVGDTIYINTWYGQQQHKFMNKYGVVFDTLYAALNDTCQQLWEFALSSISDDIRDFFPTINYNKFEIDKAKTWLMEHPGKKVLIESGPALSGYSNNFSFAPIISAIASRHPEYSFILSSRENFVFPANVFNTFDIIQKAEPSDLNEISFLSTHCDLIVGRSSGVSTFAMTRENLFKRPTKFINFSTLVPSKANKYWLGSLLQDRTHYSATFITKPEYRANEVSRIIEENL
jgi:hypothetical protein